MNCIKKYIKYLKDNPQEYWFKRKLYGWGWTPIKWQGWVVIIIGIAILIVSTYIGEATNSPSITLIGALLMMIVILFFGYKKGEKPRWQWGPDKK
ncbi:MAG: LPXTG cell wall anchor domain-containing protein [Candidatus Paceibacterota bacterium]